MKHFIIGTAGHVDHGKTVLVKALTGIETDRLKEEKERGISIELGFAPFVLPSGIRAGVVDVPGHERFIKNMLAGVGGIDLVLLVVAADEGVMPQTREHMDIIDLLQVREGIVVLTKTDLVDEDWIEMIREEVRELVKGTVLEKAPVIGVSAVTGQGIPELITLIDQVAHQLQERSVSGLARMPVDRIFTVTGFGTVITGTLAEGHIAVGATLEILPEEIQARVRGIQVHGEKVEMAEAGQRVAVNLAGIEREKIDRGSVLAAPGLLKPSYRLDIQLKVLAGAEKPILNRARVRVHIGTAEILARVILMGLDELSPGDTGFAQLECEEPIVAAKKDRLVIRSYSPMRTIAGGTVIDPLPVKHRRMDSKVIEALKTKEKGSPEELLEQFLWAPAKYVFTLQEINTGLGLGEEAIQTAITNLEENGRIKRFFEDARAYLILDSVYREKALELRKRLEEYHKSFSLRPGVSKEEIRNKVFGGLNNKIFNALLEVLVREDEIRIVGENIARHGFTPEPGAKQAPLFDEITSRYLEQGYQTSGWEEILSVHKISPAEGEEILNYLVNQRILVKLEDNILIHEKNIEKARNRVIEFLEKNGEMTLGEARDLFQTSRKFTLPLMNFFDKERVTRRLEDKRVLY